MPLGISLAVPFCLIPSVYYTLHHIYIHAQTGSTYHHTILNQDVNYACDVKVIQRSAILLTLGCGTLLTVEFRHSNLCLLATYHNASQSSPKKQMQ